MSIFRKGYLITSKQSYGSIRQGGGAFSKKEKAVEEQYFYNKEREDIKKYQKSKHLDKDKPPNVKSEKP